MKFPLGLTDLTEDHFGEIYELGSGEGKQNNKKKDTTLLKSCVVVVIGNSGRNADQEDCVFPWCVLT